jgi:hypothetical protein
MKNAFLAGILSAFLASPALAATFNIPDGSPLATVTVPDKDWKATKIDKGIELETDDDEVYLSIEAVELKDLKQIVAQAIVVMQRGGVTVDTSTEKQVSGKLLGHQYDDIGWNGKDKDGDVMIHLGVLTVSAGHAIMFTYWASPDGDKQYDPVIRTIIESLKFK